MPALGRVLIVLGDAGKCEMFKTIGLWSKHLVVKLPKDQPLADKPIIYWPDLRGERFLINSLGVEFRPVHEGGGATRIGYASLLEAGQYEPDAQDFTEPHPTARLIALPKNRK